MDLHTSDPPKETIFIFLRRFLIAPLLMSASLVNAQKAASPLSLVLEQFLVQTTSKDAKPQGQLLAALVSILPGQVLEQRLNATNVSTGTLARIRLQLPVTAGTGYLSQSGSSMNTITEFSFDHGGTYGLAPLKRKVTRLENGVNVIRDVAVSSIEYTNVRWTVPTLAAGEVINLALRVTVR